MAEPTGYIVEIDEQGNTTVKYAGGIAEYSEGVLRQLAPCKMAYAVTDQADATFSEGLDSVECDVAVKIGELEFGPFSFVRDNIPGGDDDAGQDEDVALPQAG